MRRRLGRVSVILSVVGILWAAAACATDSEDRLSREYAECLTVSNGVLHRTQLANRVGTVPPDAAAMARWLRGGLERGDTTMDEIRANYSRYCK